VLSRLSEEQDRRLPRWGHSTSPVRTRDHPRAANVVVGRHMLVHRSTVLLMELLGMQVSTGFAASLPLSRKGGFLAFVRKTLATAPVMHAAETLPALHPERHLSNWKFRTA
jgi:hypothetical protein